MIKYFNHILQGHEATEENAYDHARGLDWMEVDVVEREKRYPYLDYVDTVNGVGIWHNYGSDSYYFTDETDEESLDEGKKVVRLTKKGLERLIKEGVEKLHKKTLIENRIGVINNQLNNLKSSKDNSFNTTEDALFEALQKKLRKK